jgi:hypothetical protein
MNGQNDMRTDSTEYVYRLLIGLLLGAFLLFSGWAAYRAVVMRSSVTDADYYHKGLRYSEARAEELAASDLGWQLATELKQRQLTLHLSDRNQLPVANAAGTCMRLSPPAASALLPLAEGPAGIYTLTLPAEWQGETLLLLDFSLGGARFSRRLLFNLLP